MDFLREMDASGIAEFAPENVLSNNDKDCNNSIMTCCLDNKELEERLSLRLGALNCLNESTDLKSTLVESDSDYNNFRVKLQDFAIGNPSYTEMTDYEKNRATFLEKKRKARVDAERAARKRNYASPRITVQNYEDQFDDGQEDSFLMWYKKEFER